MQYLLESGPVRTRELEARAQDRFRPSVEVDFRLPVKSCFA